MTEKIEYTLYNILLDILNISTDVGESVDPSLESNVSLHYRFSCNDNSYQIKWMLYWIEYGICGIRFPLQSISLIDGETIETIAFAVRFGDDGTCDCDDVCARPPNPLGGCVDPSGKVGKEPLHGCGNHRQDAGHYWLR